MAPDYSAALSRDSLEQLTHLSALLHLLHHRNKNQHRRSIWYRHFSLFRRHLSHLLTDYTFLSSQPATNLEKTRKKAREPEFRTRIEQRLDFWETVLVPKWSRVFSQVVADGRFSVIGVVLVAILASACQITGLTAKFEDLGQLEVERVLEEFGREAWAGEARGLEGISDDEVGQAAAREDAGIAVAREDEGEAVAREIDEGDQATREDASELVLPPVADETSHMKSFGNEETSALGPIGAVDKLSEKDCSKGVPALKKTKKRPADVDGKPARKKKRKKGDTIDDLFSGL